MFHRPIERSAVAHRLFFALLPPPLLARRIAAAAAILPYRPLAAARLHLTLFILDDAAALDAAVVAALRRIGGALAAAPVAIVLDRLVASGRSAALRPAAVNAPLLALHREIARLAAAAGIAERHAYRVAPHLTLGYGEGAPRSERVAPVGWTADELVLIHSHVGRTRHDLLGRWRWRAAPGDIQLTLF